MADVLDRLRVAIAGFDGAVDTAAANDAWARPSPCAGWSAGDVADHVNQNYARLSRECGNDVPSSGERRSDWVAARDGLLHAASQPGALGFGQAGGRGVHDWLASRECYRLDESAGNRKCNCRRRLVRGRGGCHDGP